MVGNTHNEVFQNEKDERRCCWHYLVFFLWYIGRMFCIIVAAVDSSFGYRSFSAPPSEIMSSPTPSLEPENTLCLERQEIFKLSPHYALFFPRYV